MAILNPWNAPFLINSVTSGDQRDIKLQALSDGSFVAVWDNGDNTISMRLFKADGTEKTAQTTIKLAEGDGPKYMPVVTALSNGNFVVAWEDGSGNEGDLESGIRGQIFTSNGVKAGDDFHINAILPYTQSEVTITALSNGGFAVAYSDVTWGNDADGTDVQTRVFDAAGRPVSTDLPANSTREGGQTAPVIIGLSGGGYAIFFEDNDGSGQVIRGRYFNADGTPTHSDPSHPEDPDLDFLVSSGGGSYPKAAALSDGKFVVTWEASDGDIHAQLFDAEGRKSGSEFLVNSADTSGYQMNPAIVALKDGGFAISYTSQGDAFGVHVAAFTSAGALVEDALIQEAPGTYFSENPPSSMTVLADGRLVVSWESLFSGGEEDLNFHAQIFDPRTSAVNVTGTNAADHYVGTAWADILNGGAGADVLRGGAGNDTYYVDNAGDSVVEVSAADGVDTVVASASYALSAFVENLIASGSNAINLTGNELNNAITGNAGANVINGGAGADTMAGGAGDDTYVVDSSGDVVGDASGFDTIVTAIDYALGADTEALFASGYASLRLTGNTARNTVVGNDGNNKINGGSGNDVLVGGAGSDVFMFTTRLGNSRTDKLVNYDTITDFSVPKDTIQLDNAIFKKLGKGTATKPGKLSSKFFKIGTKAADKDDYLIYNKKTGILSYDADGSGKGVAIEFAKLAKNLKMTALDFQII